VHILLTYLRTKDYIDIVSKSKKWYQASLLVCIVLQQTVVLTV